MAPGIRILSLFLLITALSGAILIAHTAPQERPQTVRSSPDPRPERPVRPTRPEGPARNPANDNGERNRPARSPADDQQSARPVRPPDALNPATTNTPDVGLLPVAVPLGLPPEHFLGYEYSHEEIIMNVLDNTPFEYSDGWSPRWKLGYTTTITSYGFGAHMAIPAGKAGNSELFVKLGTVLFSKSTDFRINGIPYESRSALLSLSFMMKTTHTSGNNSYGEYRLYSILGGGPVIGFSFPSAIEDGMMGTYSRWGLAGEVFGALGAEFVLNNHAGYYAEAGFSYLNFAGRSFSTTPQIFSPTLSIGIRFY